MESLDKETIEQTKEAFYSAYGHYGKKCGLNRDDLFDVFTHNLNLAVGWVKSRMCDDNYDEEYDYETELSGVVHVVTNQVSLNTGKKINDFEKYIKFFIDTYFSFRNYYLTVSKKTNEDIDVNARAAWKTRDKIIEIVKNEKFY